MDKEKNFNFVQKAVSTPPLILVGSGGSAPYGLPSMTELGKHLVDSLDIKLTLLGISFMKI